jgi:diguanylate cyclase (GGDEF)-like protein/PAS domain S-box-containing protein
MAISSTNPATTRRRDPRLGARASAPSGAVGRGLLARIRAAAAAVRAALPRGRTLPDSVWARRHKGMLWLLWTQAIGIPVYAILQGYPAGHSLAEASAVAAMAALGTFKGSRRAQSVMVSLGFLTSAALAVHFSKGLIEAHFYFFVVILLLTLYEDWLPFGLAFAYVVLHHGVFGAIDPGSVYNHGDAAEHPWKWAAIHGAFVMAAGAAGVLSWRLNEDARAETLRAHRSARESEERFEKGFESAPIGMALLRPDGRYLRVNQALCDMTGYSEDELLTREFKDITHPDDLGRGLEALRCMQLGDADSFKAEKRYLRADGEVVSVLLNVSTVRDEDGSLRHFFAQMQDITERKRAELELAHSLSLQRATLESTADGILVVDPDGRIASYNEEFVRMWQLPRAILEAGDDDQAIAFVLDQLSNPEAFVSKVRELYGAPDEESYDVLEFKDGRVFERYSQPQRIGGESVGRVWSFRDVTQRRRFESELKHLADHDALTGLFNRRRFDEELSRELARASRYEELGALVVFDLDNFKYVNDTLGHQAGDQIIRSVASLLRRQLRETDIIARLGGDEFAVLLPHTAAEEAATVASGLLSAVRAHEVVVAGRAVQMTTSLGVAQFGEDGNTAEELLAAADAAMYQAKDAGRDRMHVFGPDAGGEGRDTASWIDRIRRALEENRFELQRQPILDLRTGEISQHELLVRMVGDDGELISPSGFLGVAERFGLIQSIDRWIVTEAIRLMDRELQRGNELRLEVNLSGRSLDDRELTVLIQRELAKTAVNPDNLILEITETSLISNMADAQRFAETLTRVGCRFALDDFGAGFGSYYYLKHLPVHYLKIDGDFIRSLPSSYTDQLMVKAMVQVAKGLGMKTIAEYVGDDETIAFLKEYGVDYAQGFHVGEPEPVSEAWPSAAPEPAAASV